MQFIESTPMSCALPHKVLLRAVGECVSPMPQEFDMNPMHVLAGIVAVFLLIYLVVAMLKPELFP